MELSLEPQSLIVIVNAAIAGAVIVLAGAWLARGELSVTHPSLRQSIGEFVLEFFVNKARDMGHGREQARIVRVVSPLLASFFLFIVACNIMGVFPLPILNRPPTSHFSVTLGLALCSVLGTLLVSAMLRGVRATIVHLFWPNPMQWISEFTDVASLSLRLFGNIAGEFMTLTLVLAVVPYGIPLILHTLGLIPVFVQGLVFTLLTASFLAHAIHTDEAEEEVVRVERVVEDPVGIKPARLEGRVQ